MVDCLKSLATPIKGELLEFYKEFTNPDFIDDPRYDKVKGTPMYN